jgi:uncharacterized protein YcfJ
MNKFGNLAVVAISLGASGMALANPYEDWRPYHGDAAYAEVLNAQPIYREVQVAEPRQACYPQQVVYDPGYSHHDNLAGVLIGGLVGGVVGHSIGSGTGRDLATVAGVMVGAGVGNQISRRDDRPQQVSYQERCDTVPEYHVEHRVDGYAVTYRYAGRVYHTRLPYDPGPRLPVQVNVAPAA